MAMNAAMLIAFVLPLQAPAAHEPPADASVYALAGGAKTARLPFRFVANQVRLSATLDGHGPLELILDTGMPIPGVLLFENERVGALALADTGKRVPIAGGGGEGKASSPLRATG